MKAVMLSIQPRWVELIASAKKTVEVRKTKPKIEVPFKCYIYCTQGKDWLTSVNGKVQKPNKIVLDLTKDSEVQELNGKVIGEFVCDRVTEYECSSDGFGELATTCGTCLTYDEIINYCNGNELYGWHITDLVIYEQPKELSEFYQEGKNGEKFYYDYCAGCPHHETPVGDYPCNGCDGNRNYFYRPPQSWCYCEEMK